MKQLILLFSASMLFLTGCLDQDTTNPDTTAVISGTLRDYTGLDGCSWVIVKADGDVLEPMNIDSFGIDLHDYATVFFTYETQSEYGSVCMVGEVVTLTSIRY